jgi:probable HAF family extracellular repeat protein
MPTFKIALAPTTTLGNVRAVCERFKVARRRRRRVDRNVFVLLAIVVAAPIADARAQTPTITMTDLGTLGGSQSEAKAVDATGHVVGTSWTIGDTSQHAFLWTAASGMFDLGTLGGTSSVATAISGGTIVGTSWTTGDVAQHAFMWTAAAGMRDLGTLGGTSSAATAVNAGGAVVGQSAIAGDMVQHAFAWTAERGMLDLGTLGGASSAAAAVNASGTVVGTSTITGDVQHAFIWTPAGGMVDAGTLGGSSSRAADVNASGVVVGVSAIAGDVAQHGFIWTVGSMIDLGTLGGMSSAATSVNRIGTGAGVSVIADNLSQHAFIWTPASGMLDLGTLGGLSSAATGMNDVGQVVGYSDLAAGPSSPVHHAVLWQVGPVATMLTVAAASGVFGGTTSLHATLSSAAGPVSGRSVSFSLRGTGVGAAITDDSGVATLVNVPLVGLTAGTNPGSVGAFFAGSPNDLTSRAAADLIVSQAVPIVSWSNPQPIVYGTALSAAQLNATASAPGAFVYSPQAGTVLNVGPTQSLSVTFMPADTVDFSSSAATVVLSVLPATPTITLAGVVGSGNRDVEATGPDTVVSWTAPVATDAMSRPLPVNCLPRSGSLFSLGATTVACSAVDAAGKTGTATFAVTVRDTTAPTLAVPDHVTTEASSPAGAFVTYVTLATDVVSHVVPTVCVPESGGTFPTGTTSVNCTATDTAGNSTTKSFIVTVRDTTPPSLSLPSATLVEATGVTGAMVSFAVSATDSVDGAVPVQCAPASGTVFPIATTTVTCSAVDQHGNVARGSFKITVQDTTAPTITGSGDLTVEATGPDGARVSWPPPVAADAVSGSLRAPCAPASGTVFPLGATKVRCSSEDAAGNAATATFVVSVLDTTPPNVLGIPLDLALESISPDGTPASWTMPTAVDAVDGSVAVVCSPVSGSTFAPGTTLVTCAATDVHGNRATAKFNVTIQDPTPPVIAPTITGLLGTSGWYVGDVNITWSVTDLQSSITAQTGCDPVVVTTDTASATFTCQATSAGGTASKTIAIRIDRSTPTLTFKSGSPAPNDAGWNRSPVAFGFAATDVGSGVADTSAASPLVVATEGIGLRGTVTATDAAGNVATFTTPPVNIDWTPPRISAVRSPAANISGWANSPVTIWFQCADDLSGLAAAGNPAPRVVSTQGAGQSVSGTCTDLAGNSASLTVADINVDLTPPSLTVPDNLIVQQASPAGAVVAYSAPTIVDAGSGVAASSCLPASGAVFPLGSTTVTCAATDLAGNANSATFTIRVTPDGWALGAGSLDNDQQRHHVVFRVSQLRGRVEGRLEYWVDDSVSRFEATSGMTVRFSEDAMRPDRRGQLTPHAVRFSGTGTWNGQGGYTFEASAADQPGRHGDAFSLLVKDSGGNIVANVEGALDRGNIEFVHAGR